MEQNSNRLVDEENILTAAGGGWGWGAGGEGEGTEKDAPVGAEQSWGWEARHREHSREYSNNCVRRQLGTG